MNDRVNYDDFIGVFSGVYPDNFCKHLINEFEKCKNEGFGANRQESEGAFKTQKDDYQLGLTGNNVNFEDFNDTATKKIFWTGLQNCFDLYKQQFSVLEGVNVSCLDIKMQKTTSGGGYHTWHGEQGNGDQARRSLAYMLYLNTLPKEANGETEFLYQQRRINPVENTMVIWPASFTHAHRGNPVFGMNQKYIVTGWFYNE
jgi:hypothetical protein